MLKCFENESKDAGVDHGCGYATHDEVLVERLYQNSLTETDESINREVDIFLVDEADRAEKRKRGRPIGTERGRLPTRGITVDDDRWEWLQSQPGGASETIRKMIDAARSL